MITVEKDSCLKEKENTSAAGKGLPVMESFYTIQGEGFYQGGAAYFIRLGGCDVGCVWCDVKESWDAASHPVQTIEQIVATALEAVGGSPQNVIAVITGGEPLMYDLTDLTTGLHAAGFQVNIETSGAYPISGDIDWICVSPKKFKAPIAEVVKKAHELKVIVFNKSDFQWAETYSAQTALGCKLYLQPEWSKEKEMLPLMIDYVKSHPEWTLSLQIHKYMDVP
ncbi:MAG TPA: 7-carboxy-7-deazaguanine synthase QueE [Arachidicoccus sp.]|nr:7-carboxy-7-deazaguanine synthase QueE [Arachidicoccus sp.]